MWEQEVLTNIIQGDEGHYSIQEKIPLWSKQLTIGTPEDRTVTIFNTSWLLDIRFFCLCFSWIALANQHFFWTALINLCFSLSGLIYQHFFLIAQHDLYFSWIHFDERKTFLMKI